MSISVPLSIKRWGFEHKYLPEMIYKEGAKFILPFFHDKDHLSKLFNTFCIHADGVESPYRKDEFRVCVVRFEEDVLCLELTFPEPEESPLCRNAYLFFTEELDYLCYYTLERPRDDALPKGADVEENDFSFMCAWVDDAHLNFGMHQIDSQEAMLVFNEMFECSKYAEEYREAIEKCNALKEHEQEFVTE